MMTRELILITVYLIVICSAYITPDIDTGYPAWIRESATFQGETFQCLKSGEEIPLSAVNDDVCDCQDGSDELGTGACSYLDNVQAISTFDILKSKKDLTEVPLVLASFHCRNKGFRSHPVPLSRVNDGICDCCDGSDEWQYQSASLTGSLPCPNTCDMHRKSEIALLASLLAAAESGQAQREHAREHNPPVAARREQVLALLTGEYEVKQTLLEALGMSVPADRVPEASLPGALAEHLNSLVAAQAGPAVTEEADPDSEDYFPYPAEYNPAGPAAAPREDSDPLLGGVLSVSRSAAAPGAPPQGDSVSASSLQARLRSSAARLRTLVAEALMLRGPGAQVMLHAGLCAYGPQEKYLYGFCIGGPAVQAELQAASTAPTSVGAVDAMFAAAPPRSQTSLGRMARVGLLTEGESAFADPAALATGGFLLEYDGGDKCWNGPQRGVRVSLRCGEWAVLRVREPSVCNYEVDATAPIACREGLAAQLTDAFAGVYSGEELRSAQKGLPRSASAQLKDEL